MRKGKHSCSHCDACPLVGQSSGCLHVSSHVRSFGQPYVRQCRCLGVQQAEHANKKGHLCHIFRPHRMMAQLSILLHYCTKELF